MKKQPFFSVVIPVYNVEPYLEKAVNSVLNQTFQDFEIILVNDCSTDNCKKICEDFDIQYEKITAVFHDKNRGLSAARNTGMDYAKGQYIWFMDSDDFVDCTLLEDVYCSINKNRADIVVFGLIEEYYDQHNVLHHTKQICPKQIYMDTQSEMRKQIIDLEMQTLYGYAWNKFYSLDRINALNLRFEQVVLIEDIFFNVKYCNDANSMNILSIAPYHYNKRVDNSLTAKFVPDYYKVHRERINLIYSQYCEWKLCDENVKQKLAVLYTRYIFSALQRNCDRRAEMNYKQRKIWLKSVFNDALFNELIPFGESKSELLNIMMYLLKTKKIMLCMILGRFIYIVKNKMPMLFAKIKQRR